jgi:hypothetical protein
MPLEIATAFRMEAPAGSVCSLGWRRTHGVSKCCRSRLRR